MDRAEQLSKWRPKIKSKLEDDKSVRENVDAGMGEVQQLLADFDAINMQFAEPMSDDEMTELLAKQAE